MFEAAELGRKVSKADFTERANAVHTELLAVQRKLRESKTSVIVIVSGVEGAGKGEVVNRFHEWLDARGIQTFAYWDESDEERERPPLWRFWRNLPPRGTIGIMFGSWYTRPIIDRVFGNIDDSSFERELARISELEQMLTADGALIVKFWFHLPKDVQKARLQQDIKEQKKSWKISPITKKFSKRYDAFSSVSERAIRITDTGYAPWYIVESSDRRYRDLTTGATLLDAIEERLKHAPSTAARASVRKASTPDTSESKLTVLDRVDLGKKLEEKKYTRQLRRYQRELYDLAWRARQRNINTIAVFEGWDAAGKGGAIRRVTAGIDARLYRVISVAAPTDEERAQHYLWRFWRHVPRSGYVTIYDRSWYGRVLVERVEGFAKREEWMRAYQEINDFEGQLTGHGAILLKFWVHLGQDEQLRRFKEREKIPWKEHKITDEDWRNRKQWDAYADAVNDMVTHTSTEYAPWTLLPGNDKKYSRVQVIKTFCNRLKEVV